MVLSPFSKLSSKRLRNNILITFVLFVFSILLLRYLDSFLINNVAKKGIVSFELAKDTITANNIINSWNKVSTAAAGYSLIYDFFFMVIYSLFLGLTIHFINKKVWKKNTAIYKVGVLLIYAQFSAALFDAIENISLLQVFKESTQFWTSTAYYFATAKFILIALGILFIVVSISVLLFQKKQKLSL